MAKLTENVKRFIVGRLACYDRPSDIAQAVREVFGIEVTRQQVHDYNPLGYKRDQIAQKWKDLFDETRKAFLEDTSSIPSANKAVRLRRLDRMAENAEHMKNYPLAAQILEQIAKECGDHYSNTRKLAHTSPDGSMSPTRIEITAPDENSSD